MESRIGGIGLSQRDNSHLQKTEMRPSSCPSRIKYRYDSSDIKRRYSPYH